MGQGSEEARRQSAKDRRGRDKVRGKSADDTEVHTRRDEGSDDNNDDDDVDDVGVG